MRKELFAGVLGSALSFGALERATADEYIPPEKESRLIEYCTCALVVDKSPEGNAAPWVKVSLMNTVYQLPVSEGAYRRIKVGKEIEVSCMIHEDDAQKICATGTLKVVEKSLSAAHEDAADEGEEFDR